MPFRAPVKDIRFILDHVAGFAEVSATPRFADATPDLADAILSEAGRLATDVLAPLNRVARHRAVHVALGDLARRVHALALDIG